MIRKKTFFTLTLGIMASTAPLKAADTLEEALQKVRAKYAVKAKKEQLKKEHKAAQAKLKAAQKLEILKLETSIATDAATKAGAQ